VLFDVRQKLTSNIPMQADAIPDWAIYILFTPFFPIGGFIHISLGILQAIMIVGIAVWRSIASRRDPEQRVRLIRMVYIPLLLIPNIAVVIWGILTDPAL
jgi:hypothetical protein